MLGQVGGAVAVQGALAAIGLGEAHASQTFALVRSERARGLKILVPGSGIAGMTAACELGKLEDPSAYGRPSPLRRGEPGRQPTARLDSL